MFLHVPPMPLIVGPGVFDAWSWCPSDLVEWRRPIDDQKKNTPLVAHTIEGHNPPNLVFVMRAERAATSRNEMTGVGAVQLALPTELARLHAFGYGLVGEELALAPWAIDDATDLLYEHRARPHDVFWLAASTLDALVWGLHDWAHFHNHGPFDQPAMTELQCDLLAMAWLRLNCDQLELDDAVLTRVAHDLASLSRKRFDEEENATSPADDLEALFLGPYPEHPLGRDDRSPACARAIALIR